MQESRRLGKGAGLQSDTSAGKWDTRPNPAVVLWTAQVHSKDTLCPQAQKERSPFSKKPGLGCQDARRPVTSGASTGCAQLARRGTMQTKASLCLIGALTLGFWELRSSRAHDCLCNGTGPLVCTLPNLASFPSSNLHQVCHLPPKLLGKAAVFSSPWGSGEPWPISHFNP